MKTHILIGLDPGRQTGIAVRDAATGAWLCLQTCLFWDAIDLLMAIDRQYHIDRIVIENPNLNRPYFGRNVAGQSRIAQNVGMNKRDAQLLIEYCQRRNWPVREVRPSPDTLTKLAPDTFQRLTGITQRTSAHVRDAAMLIVS